jgi:hypothetical protein
VLKVYTIYAARNINKKIPPPPTESYLYRTNSIRVLSNLYFFLFYGLIPPGQIHAFASVTSWYFKQLITQVAFHNKNKVWRIHEYSVSLMNLQVLDVFKINFLHTAKWPIPRKCSQPFKTFLTFLEPYVYCLVQNIPAILPNLSRTIPVDMLPFGFLKLYFILIIFFYSWIYQKWSLSFKSSYHKFLCNYFLYVPLTLFISFYSMYSFGQEKIVEAVTI